ncbi:MAG TPA: pyridoxal-phosphate dependent enzyme [Bacteroidales bacterium]|nr:pyridoxal-phosphate dependent enzyme [Bacteroidales bacterium]
MNAPKIEGIIKAHERILGHVHKTPVLSSESINSITQSHLLFKCENFQKVGAFKFRGATNAVKKLSTDELSRGVCTHSSGNHAQALSLAAKQAGTKAYIVMPETAPRIKVNAVKSYGADIFFCKPTLAAREEKLEEVQKRTGAHFIHPYNHPDIIAGQGTAAFELINDYPDLDLIMAPVGGGGLMGGTSIAAHSMAPSMEIYGAEPANADDAKRSLESGRLIPSVNPNTIADGLLTSLSDLTFQILSDKLDGILTCTEDSILQAMKLIYERMKIVVEPSGAVPLAVVLEHPDVFRNKRCGLIISGGNLDLARFDFSAF